MEWIIFYGDGTTFDSTQGNPEDAERYDICCIVLPDPDCGRMILYGWDWYMFKDGAESEWSGHDIHGLVDQLLHDQKRLIRAVAQGRCYATVRFKDIYRRAVSYGDLMVKCGWKKDEANLRRILEG